MSDSKVDLDELYRAEGWGDLAEAALKIRPQDVESAAREVARYASALINALTIERDQLLKRLEKYEGCLCVNCGRVLSASHDRREPVPDCPTPTVCTIDMTLQEAFEHWRKIAHDQRMKLRTALAAWDSLLQGNHSPRVVQEWLFNKMAPAMQGVRDELKRNTTPASVPNRHKRKPEGYVTLGELADMSMKPAKEPGQ